MEPEVFSHFARNRESLGLAALLRLWLELYPHRRLPPVRDITETLRISSRDVVAHLDELRTQGLVETRAGSGSWPTGTMPTPGNPRHSPRQAASDLAHEIREGIATGKYPSGERLPTAKELARSWKCHPRTASRALDMLVSEGRLERDSRGWKVPRPRTPSAKRRPKILLVGAADGTGILRMDTDREIDFWREVSTEIARNGLESARHFWTGGSLAIPPGTLGLIVSTWHHIESAPLLEAARATRLPVCTWMEGLDPATLKSLAKHERLHLHDVAHSEQAGHDMGSHLLDRSATRLAWIAPFQKAAWSRSREAGLYRSLSEHRATARSFCLEGLSEWDYLEPAWSDPTLLRTLPLPSLQSLTGGRGRPIVALAPGSPGASAGPGIGMGCRRLGRLQRPGGRSDPGMAGGARRRSPLGRRLR